MRRLIYVVGGAVVLGAASFVFLSMTTPKAADHAASAPKPIPVMAARAQAQDVPIILRGLGTVTAYNAVALRSRVEGAITQVNFREGQSVKAGDLLIQLDPRPFEAALDQAKATLMRDQAALANAKTDLARYSDLLKRSFSPEQQVATQQTTVAQDTAAGQSDEAAIKAAQLNVDYASLRSPIDGVTGIRQIDIGNLIQANSAQTLVMITQIEPIYVIFTLPEANIDRVRDAMAKGTLAIQAFAANDRRKIADGKLDLIDNTVDQTTGTVKLKAEFANADRALWPGQFVNAHAVLSTVHNGITVPSTAVLTGPKGSFTYVIDDKSQVSIRQVTVLQAESNRILIGSGLKVGEQVVTAGQFRLQPGAKVKVSDQIADAGQTLSDAPAGTDVTE
ncbi:efflux RND transporter periplasmic adaptor subunit [Beijerinckia sp. L45]|uniref:efflux RND transporter periplasmic adaptor subunit n=1 Tax=Beijerinckia sp. L45 TaxID=1641855 RepID=UPI001FEFD720|nr:efflux RND transporter periplasmic adaptor subunit [Beijerinckia sp. L45]